MCIVLLLVISSLSFGQAASYRKARDKKDAYAGTIVLVDKNCIDGKYILSPQEKFLKVSEFPTIQDLVNSYSKSNYMGFIYGVLGRRYPTGKSIIEQGGGQQAVDKWLWSKETAQSVLNSLGMAVHEIGHGIDKQVPQNWYFITVDKNNSAFSFTTPGMHGKKTTSQSPMYSMERSLLLADDQNYKRPPAKSDKIFTSKEFGEGPFGCDKSYAETYLCGDPNNSSFESGDQGYNSLIEEYVQYVNSLAMAYYFIDYTRASSDRHALYTWLWWNERYLKKIRNEHPDQYKYLLDNKVWLELILTLWGRAWLYLSTGIEGMQPDSDYLHKLVQEEVMLSEIQKIRDACNCNNPVELLPDQVIINGKMVNTAKGKQVSYYSYPNPFINKAHILLMLNHKQSVTVEIFNSKGINIQTLHHGQLDKGIHTFTWDGRNRSGITAGSGLYFYQIATENAQYEGKLIKSGT
jgi:hypothetical protein